MDRRDLSLEEKALRINLDPTKYGTIAEIGAGQEVARTFFRVGGAAGTVAKSISAYDMQFSDAIYGDCERYVSKARVQTMLAHEYDLLVDRLSDSRGKTAGFFVFADTVATRSYSRAVDGKGWLGITFQTSPGVPPSTILLHVRLMDTEAVAQQEALGQLGVNLMYGALFLFADPHALISSLLDQLTSERIDVNVVQFSGPAFEGVDNRLMNLHLIQAGLTHAVMFDQTGAIVEPGEILYKKPILVQRGTFRPTTLVHEDMLGSALNQFSRDVGAKAQSVVTLMEITMANLRNTASFDTHDFVSRMETLTALGRPVLISNFSEFYRLENYLNRYSGEAIAFAIGVPILRDVFNEDFYRHLEGGILEAFGRLFRRKVRLYIYPKRNATTGGIDDATNVELPAHLTHLYTHLTENGFIRPLRQYDERVFPICSQGVLAMIQSGDPRWRAMVPDVVAELIEKHCWFDYQPEPKKLAS